VFLYIVMGSGSRSAMGLAWILSPLDVCINSSLNAYREWGRSVGGRQERREKENEGESKDDQVKEGSREEIWRHEMCCCLKERCDSCAQEAVWITECQPSRCLWSSLACFLTHSPSFTSNMHPVRKEDRKLRPQKENSDGGDISSVTESCKAIEGKGRNGQHYKMREYTTN
jgi:hypothetical protein